MNCDPSKDSDHTIDAENMSADEPDHILDSVEVKTMGVANDINGHPSQEFDVQIDVENSNIDEPDIIHDCSKTNDASAEQTESMVDDDVEQYDRLGSGSMVVAAWRWQCSSGRQLGGGGGSLAEA